ncbi:MAG: SUMF1/EgtB/PvdO family nonheme iron enzyme [Acidobacteria bacterium]|nr:SUMF1/EgtB/PvdO family nonheme iron enzyme [Acidobacteriota bacterium]
MSDKGLFSSGIGSTVPVGIAAAFVALAGWTIWDGTVPAPSSYTNSVGIRLVRVPAGSFVMGSAVPESDSWDEQPAHRVTISRPFWISESEVTVEQYRRFRPGFLGSMVEMPSVTGIGWDDATGFCAWLSRLEGKTYRLPTEAEWEYAARAGTSTPFWSGESPPDEAAANPWGLKCMHSGAREWCLDWYGPYAAEAQIDPVGPASGLVKAVRGGGLDRSSPHYARSANRAGYAPAFRVMEGTEPSEMPAEQPPSEEPSRQGLIGVWYGRVNHTDPKAVDEITTLDLDWKTFQQPGQDRGEIWSARWEGFLTPPVTGPVTFHVQADRAAEIAIDGRTVVGGDASRGTLTGIAAVVKGKRLHIAVSYAHDHGEQSFLRVLWSWDGAVPAPVPPGSLSYSPAQHARQRSIAPRELQPGHHTIGFRIVQAEMPPTQSGHEERPFIQECVVQAANPVQAGPDPRKPWLRRRPLLPVPPVSAGQEESRAAGLWAGMMAHIHNPALEVLPNGDLLAVLFTSRYGPGGEDRPEVALIATRLRFGSDEWDMPEPLIDFPDVNDTSAFLWSRGKTVYLFWGHTFLNGAYPFQWTATTDSGATWSHVRFPRFVGEIGPHSRQPINSAVRTADGTFYLPSDAIGGSSLLWASKDEMATWYDTGGRTLGRHTTIALLRDGRILGMGGKTAHIEGCMPKSITADGGKNWIVGKTEFPALASGQRPSLQRLQSGRLFFVGDLQDSLGRYPPAVRQRGAYVALSEDEGETWTVKKLEGTLPADPAAQRGNPYQTLGYTIARQAPNGIIHMVTTKTVPVLHWELNEAWILSKDASFMEYPKQAVSSLREYREIYPSGRLRSVRRGGVTPGGEFKLHGRQVWYYEDGRTQWDVGYDAGVKVGRETFYRPDGKPVWAWIHRPDSRSVWTQYWPDGRKRCESTWSGCRADGPARSWDRTGRFQGETRFLNGRSAR